MKKFKEDCQDLLWNKKKNAKLTEQQLKAKGITSPEIAEYKYRVRIGSAIHFTNDEKKFRLLQKRAID